MTFCYPLVEAGGLDRGSLFAIIRWILRSSPKLQRRKLEVKDRICNLPQIAHVQTSFLLLPFKNLVFSSTFTTPPPHTICSALPAPPPRPKSIPILQSSSVPPPPRSCLELSVELDLSFSEFPWDVTYLSHCTFQFLYCIVFFFKLWLLPLKNL